MGVGGGVEMIPERSQKAKPCAEQDKLEILISKVKRNTFSGGTQSVT